MERIEPIKMEVVGGEVVTLETIKTDRTYHAITHNGEVLYKTRPSDTPVARVKEYLDRCVCLTPAEIKGKLFITGF